MLKRIFVALFVCATAVLAAHIEVSDAYVRAVPPNLKNSAAFMEISNTSQEEVFLLRATSPVASTVELHEHVAHQGMMKMRPVEKIAIAPHSRTSLQPSGLHVMLIGLNTPLHVGETVTLELHFSNGEEITLKEVPIKSVMMGMHKH
ncbi:MAG: copper chaperone PCu(A)C [Campylobacterales bacterium]|nr:copper chaperone PCu(A)C [Campylobacterales bacterium]